MATTASLDHVDPWADLPERECRLIWDATEKKFRNRSIEDGRDEMQACEDLYRSQATGLRQELDTLTERHKELQAVQERLARELAQMERDIGIVRNARDDVAQRYDILDNDHRMRKQDVYEHQHDVLVTMTNFFRAKRGDAPLTASEIDIGQGEPLLSSRAAGVDEKVADIVTSEGNVIGPLKKIEPSNQWLSTIQALPVQRPVCIRRGRTFTQDTLEQTHVLSEPKGVRWIACMIQATGVVQSKRCSTCEKNQGAFAECVIVGGPLFSKCGNCEWNRQGCHEASGETIENGCQPQYNGSPNHGPQQQMLGITNGLSSHGPSIVSPAAHRLGASAIARPQPAAASTEQSGCPPVPSPNTSQSRESPVRGQRAVSNQSSTAQSNSWQGLVLRNDTLNDVGEGTASAARAVDGGSGKHPPEPTDVPPSSASYDRQLPSLRSSMSQEATQSSIIRGYAVTTGFTPANARSRLPSYDGQLPSVRSSVSQEATPPSTTRGHAVTTGFTPANARSRLPSHETPATPAAASTVPSPQVCEDGEPNTTLAEITKANLILQNDGRIYTFPPSMYGVPLEKVDENHWYWEPSWKNVRSVIEPQLKSWKEKHQAAIDAEKAGKKGGSSKYQVGRQVNRGHKILEFLDHGTISPYQLLGKKLTHTGKGGIISYDTLFRLSESLSELQKFNLDVSPVDWLRHRLHELMTEQDGHMNLGRTIHDFYHDPKLTALRYKHGFKNIGRPSGAKWAGQKDSQDPDATPPASELRKKRKPSFSYDSTPQRSPRDGRSPIVAQMSLGRGSVLIDPPSQESPQKTQKRAKLATSEDERPEAYDQFQVDDASDADSWSGAAITPWDWRLYQVKTRLYTSATQVTHYWAWKERGRCMEHQPLKETDPVQWGRYREPINFDVKLDEVVEVRWNIEALRVHFVMRVCNVSLSKKDGRPRGDIMASFKRERTIRRFLRFCREQGLTMTHESLETMEKHWQEMESDQLLSDDDDAGQGPRE